MPLYPARKREEEFQRREAAGENVWTPEFDDDAARGRLRHLIFGLVADDDIVFAREKVLWSTGADCLVAPGYARLPDARMTFAEGEDEHLIALIEALSEVLTVSNSSTKVVTRETFTKFVNEILREHRIAWELIDGQMVPFESREMHVEVVAPTLSLLGGRARWGEVEAAYRKALREISADPPDAIMAVGTALQEALTLLGCDGAQLKPLAKSALAKGIIQGYDIKLVDWIAADRGQKGGTHRNSDASPDDAWLAVHVGGALILRLASDDGARGSAA